MSFFVGSEEKADTVEQISKTEDQVDSSSPRTHHKKKRKNTGNERPDTPQKRKKHKKHKNFKQD